MRDEIGWSLGGRRMASGLYQGRIREARKAGHLPSGRATNSCPTRQGVETIARVATTHQVVPEPCRHRLHSGPHTYPINPKPVARHLPPEELLFWSTPRMVVKESGTLIKATRVWG